jgi:hypothetical protein
VLPIRQFNNNCPIPKLVGTDFEQDAQLKTTMNIPNMLVGLAAAGKPAISMEGVNHNGENSTKFVLELVNTNFNQDDKLYS